MNVSGRLKRFLKFSLWFLFFFTFTLELVKIVFELSPDTGHQKLSWASASFWSSLFLLELIMACLVIYNLVTCPARRKRLSLVSLCHFTVILVLPTLFNDWSWTCLLYPWPHSLQAFDPATPQEAFTLSVVVGFLLVPLITFKWGAKGFCGYVCPHGAFFSETYGRVFPSRPGRMSWVGNYIPPFFFILMAGSLVVLIVEPAAINLLRAVQKYVYFFTAEYFYFVIGIPLIGGRSYCRMVCPMGYFVNLLVRLRKRLTNRYISANPVIGDS